MAQKPRPWRGRGQSGRKCQHRRSRCGRSTARRPDSQPGQARRVTGGEHGNGHPALETLVLNARDAVNIYGSVALDASSLERVVFGAPAIYGYGAAGDVATIRAGEFIWTGVEGTRAAPVAALLGHGALNIEAKSILFGHGPNTQPVSNAIDERLALGFANVNLTASERILASGRSTLSVHDARRLCDRQGWQYAGGNLSITTPLITGEAGSKFTVDAGGEVMIGAPGAASNDATVHALGAQIAIAGSNITLDTNVVLPSGRLTLEAAGNLTLGDKARIDLAGREIDMFDVKKYSWGGDLVLASTGGDIRTAAEVDDRFVGAEQSRRHDVRHSAGRGCRQCRSGGHGQGRGLRPI
jgi:hypothetical protein